MITSLDGIITEDKQNLKEALLEYSKKNPGFLEVLANLLKLD